MASAKKVKDLKQLLDEGASSWTELKSCLLQEGWADPTREQDVDGPSLVGERIYVLGYGPGMVEDFMPSKMGASKHLILLDDGPRREKISLRRKGNNKVPWLIKTVLRTAYRRKRLGLTHRDPWSQNTKTLSRALTADEANKMWTSFDDESQEGARESFRSTDSEGCLTPRENTVEDRDPSKPMGLRLYTRILRDMDDVQSPPPPVGPSDSPRDSDGTDSPELGMSPVVLRSPPVRLGAMRHSAMSLSAPQLGSGLHWNTNGAVSAPHRRLKV
jgi:hypothetical protein